MAGFRLSSVSDGEIIGVDAERDRARFTVSDHGVVCVGKSEVV